MLHLKKFTHNCIIHQDCCKQGLCEVPFPNLRCTLYSSEFAPIYWAPFITAHLENPITCEPTQIHNTLNFAQIRISLKIQFDSCTNLIFSSFNDLLFSSGRISVVADCIWYAPFDICTSHFVGNLLRHSNFYARLLSELSRL